LDCGLQTIPPIANITLEERLSMDELLQAIKKEKQIRIPAVM
jgi:hypothetical protein